MMGRQPNLQQKLFYDRIRLDQRIRSDHVLRQIAQHIDFDFTYSQVQDTCGANGNVSVPPPVILKMMLLLILYNVRSERELLATIPERLDWLWFLGFDLDNEVPNGRECLQQLRGSMWGRVCLKNQCYCPKPVCLRAHKIACKFGNITNFVIRSGFH